MKKKMIYIQIEKHTEYFTKLLSFDCHRAKNEPRNAVNSAFLGSCTLLKLPICLTQMLNIFGFSLYLTTVFICFSRYIFIFMCNRYHTGITLVSPQQILLIPSHHPRGDLKICFFAIFIL